MSDPSDWTAGLERDTSEWRVCTGTSRYHWVRKGKRCETCDRYGLADDDRHSVAYGTWECDNCGATFDAGKHPPRRVCCVDADGVMMVTRLDEKTVGPLPAEPTNPTEERLMLEAQGQMRMAL